MADTTSSIFNQRAAEKLRRPDDLNKYVRVTNPNRWVVLASCAALLAGLLAWGVFGAVSTSVAVKGAVVESQPICLLNAEDVAKVSSGDVANFGGNRMQVKKVSSMPFSRTEMEVMLGSDYLESTLTEGDWAYLVTFEGDVSGLAEMVPLPVNITTELVSPLEAFLGGQG